MPAPLVSVVIPVYNRPAAVRRAIASVLAQTHQALDIIVVDDGSTDGTCDAVCAIPDSRIRLVRHSRNRGGSAARNTGIRASAGPFVAFLDSDDHWLPEKLARQLAVFDGADASLGLVYSGAELVYPGGRVEVRIARRYEHPVRELLVRNVIGETSIPMVRREALEATGGFDEALPSSQDKDLWVRIAERFAVDCVPEPLVRIERTDEPRISTHVPSWVKGREIFYAKHADKLARERVRHLFLRESGWVYLRYARDARTARHYYRRAIAAGPFAPLSHLHLAAACMPIAWLERIAAWKHRLTAAVERSRERHRGSRTITSHA